MNPKPILLIVEDEYIIADQIACLVLSKGYTVCNIVDNYTDAIESLIAFSPDLVIADIHLGDDHEGGIKIGEYIQRNLKTPIVYLSGYSDPETLFKAKQTQPNTFLLKPKPLEKEQLLTTIQMALPTQSQNKDILTMKGRSFTKQQECKTFIKKTCMMRYKINLSEIFLIESYNHIIKNTIVLRSIKDINYLLRSELEQFHDKLPEHFIRTHKSYIINSKYINGMKIPDFIMVNNSKIPVGEKYRDFITVLM